MSDILVPLDGSPLAEQALPLAAELARLDQSGLRLIQATLSPTSLEAGIAVEVWLQEARKYLEERARSLRHPGLPVTIHNAVAPAVSFILKEAAAPGVSAVVMSTHGRTGLPRLLMGSVAEGVLRDAPVPVYLVPARAAAVRMAPRHMLVPLDGSDLSYSVMAPVAHLARAARARLTLFRVFRYGEELGHGPEESTPRLVEQQLDRLEAKAHAYFAPIAAHLRASGLKVATEWAIGAPDEEILAKIDLIQPDLIALATHGRSGLHRLRYGSVSESILRHASVPVMTFGPRALQRLARDVGALADATPAGATAIP